MSVRRIAATCFAATLLLLLTTPASAQPAPTGPHPRIWLDAGTRAQLAAQAGDSESGVARGAARCAAARSNPEAYSSGGWQGFELVTTLSSCLIAWEATKDANDLTTAIHYFEALLDDYQSVGDGAGGDDVVSHDSGYAMRTFAPYSALAYDWLHDAPGVTEALRQRARGRFAAWMSWYAEHGYLAHVPGANYQAGYLFAATLIAIAEGGEAGATGDAHWATVRDLIWGKDMAPALSPGGVLEGGDWPEGWAYGPLSVLEYALAARALEENGVSVPGLEEWASSLVARFRHGLTPASRQLFAAGDTDAHTAHLPPPSGPLTAALMGSNQEAPRLLAQHLREELSVTNENPLFDALATARSASGVGPGADAPRHYLARGAGNWYLRSDWSAQAVWSVFQCAHRLVPDHQHNDAGNWVLTRGADDLVVDPSPYGSLSSLSSNAPAVDSNVLPPGYSPSQADWGKTTGLRWARQLTAGTSIARCDYSDQFRSEDEASDVPGALRDFVLVPHEEGGTVVLLDRVVTGDSQRGMRLRVRSPAALSLDGDVASATLGSSVLFVRRLMSTNGEPSVREMPRASECSAAERASCDGSRLPTGTEYRIDVMGPAARALHVVDALPAGTAAPGATVISGPGVGGVIFERGGRQVAVVANDRTDAVTGDALSYRVPAAPSALHVVVDAPVGGSGRSDVSAAREGSECAVTVSPRKDTTGGHWGAPLAFGVTSDCAILQEAEPLPGVGGTGAGGASASAADEDVSGGCACRISGGVGLPLAAMVGVIVAFLASRWRARPHP